MRFRTTAVAVLGVAVAWVAVATLLSRGKPPSVGSAPALLGLGFYETGMDLRQAFESLPAPAGPTTLTLLLDNSQAWVARWRLLAQAEHRLDISYFIVREDLFGAAFLGHLLHQARRGVAIRLLFDGQGTAMSFVSPRGNDWLDTLANTDSVEVKIFRPLLTRYIEALFTLNPVALVASEHDKILVADGRVAMIGGRNISAEYFADPAETPQAFEDADVILEGETAARYLTEAFEVQYRREAARPIRRESINLASYAEELLLAYEVMDAWLRGISIDSRTEQRLHALGLTWREDLASYPRLRGALAARAPMPDAHAEVRLLDSRTRLEPQQDVIGTAIARLAQSARSRILIVSPYLVLSDESVRLLATVGARGVEITVLTNGPISSDNAWSQAFFLEQWPEVLARVPGLRLFVVGPPRTMHSKLVVFDEQVALIGTYNLDPISMEVNSEIMAAVWSSALARDIARHPRDSIARGAPFVYEYRIERDPAGNVRRGSDGRPIVTFGPADHADPDAWRKIQMYRTVLRTAHRIGGLNPLF